MFFRVFQCLFVPVCVRLCPFESVRVGLRVFVLVSACLCLSVAQNVCMLSGVEPSSALKVYARRRACRRDRDLVVLRKCISVRTRKTVNNA